MRSASERSSLTLGLESLVITEGLALDGGLPDELR